MLIRQVNSLLIKENRVIDDKNIIAISYQNQNIRLQKKRINVKSSNNVEISNINYNTFFAYFFNYFSNAKHEIRKKR